MAEELACVTAEVDFEMDEDMDDKEKHQPATKHQHDHSASIVTAKTRDLDLSDSQAKKPAAFDTAHLIPASDAELSELAMLRRQKRNGERKESRQYTNAKKKMVADQKGATPSKIIKVSSRRPEMVAVEQQIQADLATGGAAAYHRLRDDLDRYVRENCKKNGKDAPSKSVWTEQDGGADEQSPEHQKHIIMNKMEEVIEEVHGFKRIVQAMKDAFLERMEAGIAGDKKRSLAAKERYDELKRGLDAEVEQAKAAEEAQASSDANEPATYQLCGLAFRPR